MKKLLVTVFGLFLANSLYAQEVQLNTYYPSPYGVYQKIKLIPMAVDEAAVCSVGTIITNDNGQNNKFIYFCEEVNGRGTWSLLDSGRWTQVGSYIFPKDTSTLTDLKVGIGTSTPDARLTIKSEGLNEAKKNFHILNKDGTSLLTVHDNGNVGINVKQSAGAKESLQVGDNLDPSKGTRKILIQGGANPKLSLKFAEYEQDVSDGCEHGNCQHGFQLMYDGAPNVFKILAGSHLESNPASNFPSLGMVILRENREAGQKTRIAINPQVPGVENTNHIDTAAEAEMIENTLEIDGNMSIGTDFAVNNVVAPLNGLLVQGNVGIGTSTPTQALHIKDTMRLEPRTSAVGNCNAAATGVLYVRSGSPAALCYCDGNGWNNVFDNSAVGKNKCN